MIALDTNLLVYAHRGRSKEHAAAFRAIEQASVNPRGFGVPLACIVEFWSVVTHPTGVDRPSTPAEAREFIDRLLEEAGANIWLPTASFGEKITRLAADIEVRGRAIFDLQIALTALENGAREIWTHDSRFVTLPGLPIHDPL